MTFCWLLDNMQLEAKNSILMLHTDHGRKQTSQVLAFVFCMG